MSKYRDLVDVIYRVNVKVAPHPQLWVHGFGGWHSKLDSELELVGMESLQTYVSNHLSKLCFKPAMNAADCQPAADAAQAELDAVLADKDFDTLTDYLTYLTEVGVRVLRVANLEIVIQPISIVNYQDEDWPVSVLLSHPESNGCDFQLKANDLSELFSKLQAYMGAAFAGNVMQRIADGKSEFGLCDWNVVVDPESVDYTVVMTDEELVPATLNLEYYSQRHGAVTVRIMTLNNHLENTIADTIETLQIPAVPFMQTLAGAYLKVSPYGRGDSAENITYSYHWTCPHGIDQWLSVEFK